jgi:hypothetical protein
MKGLLGSLALLALCLGPVPSLAQSVKTPDRSPPQEDRIRFASFITNPIYKQFIHQRVLDILTAAHAGCSQRTVTISSIVRVKRPALFSPSSPAPVDGEWQESVVVKECPEVPMLNILVVPKPDTPHGSILHLITVVEALRGRLKRERDCGELSVTNTDAPSGHGSGAWSEIWHITACQKPVRYSVSFVRGSPQDSVSFELLDVR